MARKPKETNAKLADKIELKPVTWLKPFDGNARTHPPEQLDEIAASVTAFGFTNPILAQADGTIIAGHGRLEAVTTRLDWDEVPVIILDHLTPEQARLLVLADNKIALNAGWDEEKLAEELLALETMGLSLELTGFSQDELDEYLGEDPPPNNKGDQEPEKSIYQEMSFTILKAKARKIKAALRAAVDGDTESDSGEALVRLAEFFLEHIKENKKEAKKKGTAEK